MESAQVAEIAGTMGMKNPSESEKIEQIYHILDNQAIHTAKAEASALSGKKERKPRQKRTTPKDSRPEASASEPDTQSSASSTAEGGVGGDSVAAEQTEPKKRGRKPGQKNNGNAKNALTDSTETGAATSRKHTPANTGNDFPSEPTLPLEFKDMSPAELLATLSKRRGASRKLLKLPKQPPAPLLKPRILNHPQLLLTPPPNQPTPLRATGTPPHLNPPWKCCRLSPTSAHRLSLSQTASSHRVPRATAATLSANLSRSARNVPSSNLSSLKAIPNATPDSTPSSPTLKGRHSSPALNAKSKRLPPQKQQDR